MKRDVDDGEGGDDDEDNEDAPEPEEAIFVAEDLKDVLDSANIIPRGKRRSALASGLASAQVRQSFGSSSAAKRFDSDDEEGDF